jgi:acetyl-CoA acetyltransferase
MEARIVGAAEAPYERHASRETTTEALLGRAVREAVADAGLELRDVDGLAVASFTLAPDTAIDLAWKLGLRLRWLLQTPLGGASALEMLRQATRAVDAGDASVVVSVAGDRFLREEFAGVSTRFNRTVAEELAPIGYDGANVPFSLVTQRHMRAYGLQRTDYAQIPLAQRRWAGRNPNAVYRAPLSLDEYLAAPIVAPPLCIYDCVPRVSGADAVVVAGRGVGVRLAAFAAAYNPDGQEGDGLSTGLAGEGLWNLAAVGPDDVDLLSVYDDYPVMVLVQLAELGVAPDPASFVRDRLPRLALNTSGGQLSAGQAGAAGGMHGLVEAVRQLRGEAGDRQVAGVRRALVTGYGMLPYRYGACANAAVLAVS